MQCYIHNMVYTLCLSTIYVSDIATGPDNEISISSDVHISQTILIYLKLVQPTPQMAVYQMQYKIKIYIPIYTSR